MALQLLRDGTPLPTRVVEGEDGPSQVAVLEGLPAGSSGGRGVTAAANLRAASVLELWQGRISPAMWCFELPASADCNNRR